MKLIDKRVLISGAFLGTALLGALNQNESTYPNISTQGILDFRSETRAPRPKPKPKPTNTPAPKPQQSTQSAKKKLTLMIYMAGDNNLEPYIDYNRRQMEKEGVDADMNMLLFICTHRRNEPKLAVKAIIKDRKFTILERVNGLDSGKKETLISACAWAAQYPADNMAIILWDHGSGPLNKNARRGICYDNTTGHFLTDSDLYDAFSTITKNYLHNDKFAFIGFDACLMSAIEIASTIKPFARYMISSEHTISALGWPYNLILGAFKTHKATMEEFIKNDFVASYKKCYDSIMQDYTLSCVDLTKIDPLTENVNAISKVLIELLSLQKNKSVTTTLGTIAAETTRFEEPAYADLYDWYSHILAKVNQLQCVNSADTTRLVTRLKYLATQGILLVRQAVVSAVQGTVFSQTHGLLIYLPEHYIDKTYLTTQWAQKN